MTNRTSLALAFAVVLALGAATTHGWEGQKNTIRFGGAVTLPGVVLPAGEYQFEVMRVASEGMVVRVTRTSDRRPYFLGFTQNVERPRSLGDRTIVLGEASAGSPPPIRAWYPIDGDKGHEFIY